ncbi:hypothetical protein Q0M94_25060 (plasmid) [Deinococcus radiomollis]|uniref:hypothetical protein n=1 Tax=Deinococcus radiomollis TaxID=468916 RepID=UPI00389138B3
MTKITIGLMALTLSVASTAFAAPKATMTGTMITPKMTAAMCTKGGGMVKMVKGKNMCMMAPMKK